MTTQGQEFRFPDEATEVEVDLDAGKIIEPAVEPQKDEGADPEIEVVDDTPEVDRGRVPGDPPEDPTEEELSSYDEKVRKRIKRFTRGYHDERRAKEQALRERQAAEELARQAIEENRRLKAQLTAGSEQYVSMQQKLAERELAEAQRAYQEAFENNDAAKMAEVQAAISAAAMRVERAKETKPLQLVEDVVKPAQPQAPKLDPKTEAWKQRNEWFGTNRAMTAYALGLHEEVVAKGYVAGSDAYFSEIDRDMRRRFPEAFGSSNEPAAAADRASKPATVVAPSARSTPPNRIRVTESEARMAKKLGVPLELYAKAKAAQQKDSRNG